jgi:hypothetical protein
VADEVAHRKINTTDTRGVDVVGVFKGARERQRFYKSSRRDLNPRPVAAATALPAQVVELISTPSGIEVAFPSGGFGACLKGLTVFQNPRQTMAGCFGMACVMPIKSLSDILA